ncbi:MAG: helix-turn-helix domain-containing protein [Verrucomicrobia bacterium]|nr:helix-turn-helix domain-containing protein [Verrucomicrobiota bacterium]
MNRPHAHPDVELNFLVSGGPLHYRQAEGKTAVKRHELLVFWAGLPHQLFAKRGFAPGVWATIPLSLILEWDLPGEFAARLLRGEYFRSAECTGDTQQMNRWVADLESGDPIRLKALLLELHARLHRLAMDTVPHCDNQPSGRHPGGDRHLARIVGFMAGNYRQPLSVQQIAAAAGLNPRYAMRLFRKNFHMSIWEYLTRMRITHAGTMLALTKRKVLDIAMECGFGSSSAFYSAFAKYSNGSVPGAVKRGPASRGRR